MGYGGNTNFISETFNIPLLLLFSLFGFGGIFAKSPVFPPKWEEHILFKDFFTEKLLSQRNPHVCPSSNTLCVGALSRTFHAPNTGRQEGVSLLFWELARKGYIEVQPTSSKAQRLPQHLLLRLVSLGLNSHADYNELQNLLILGRK